MKMMEKSVKLKALAALMLVSLAACVVPETQKGNVVEITDRMVKIRGAYSMDGGYARPTQAMVQQAQEICPGAKYISADPTLTDNVTFIYLFQCK